MRPSATGGWTSVEVVPGGQRRIDRVLPEPDVEELTRAVEALAAEEEKVSTHPRAVQRVVDVLRSELARRCRDGTAQVSQLLE